MDAVISVDEIWRQFGLDGLETGLKTLFPDYSISLRELMDRIMQGDLLDVLSGLGRAVFGKAAGQMAGMRNVLIWILALGILSAVLSSFVEIFDKRQVADFSFYFTYLLLTAVLLECFGQAADTAKDALYNIVDFIRLLMPAYLAAAGIAAGAVTAAAYYQIILLIVYGVEKVLLAGIIPFIYSYCMLAVVGGIWTEGKLSPFIELLGKGIRLVLKASVGIVTGLSIFQAAIAPIMDFLKSSALQKAISAIPGIGDAAGGAVELVIGSAVAIKNSVGVILLILLLLMCALPLLRIFLIACLLKAAAALIGIVCDRRITFVTDRVGEGSILLLRTVGTALFLFFITISALAVSFGGRI